MASIAINGLGRIGRAALKILEQTGGAEVVAVNDLVPLDNLAYLLATTPSTAAGTRPSPRTATPLPSAAGRSRCSPSGTRPDCRGGNSAWTWCWNAPARSAARKT